MIRLKLTIVAAGGAIAMIGAPAPAQDKPATPEKPEKKICRLVAPLTGSMLTRARECHTKAEWAAIAERNEKEVDRFRDGRDKRAVSGALNDN